MVLCNKHWQLVATFPFAAVSVFLQSSPIQGDPKRLLYEAWCLEGLGKRRSGGCRSYRVWDRVHKIRTPNCEPEAFNSSYNSANSLAETVEMRVIRDLPRQCLWAPVIQTSMCIYISNILWSIVVLILLSFLAGTVAQGCEEQPRDVSSLGVYRVREMKFWVADRDCIGRE